MTTMALLVNADPTHGDVNDAITATLLEIHKHLPKDAKGNLTPIARVKFRQAVELCADKDHLTKLISSPPSGKPSPSANALGRFFFEICKRDRGGHCLPRSGGFESSEPRQEEVPISITTAPAGTLVSETVEAEEEEEAHPGAGYGSSVTVEDLGKDHQVFKGKPVPIKNSLTKQETGRVGEAIIVAYLQSLGFDDAGHMNTTASNFPIDLIEDHRPTEVKAGLCSNSQSAQQWRLTFSQESKTEKELYSKMTEVEKEAYNSLKQERIHERKRKIIKSLSEEYGVEINPRTMTVIINPDTRMADVYEFSGFHDRIGWNSPQAKAGYRTTVRYGHPETQQLT